MTPYSVEPSEKRLDHAKQSATDAFENSPKKVIQITAKATGNLTGNKIPDKISRVSKNSPKNTSETNEEEIIREKYISPELRQKTIDDLNCQ